MLSQKREKESTADAGAFQSVADDAVGVVVLVGFVG